MSIRLIVLIILQYVSQVIMLHTWNIHSAVCQLYLSKLEKNQEILYVYFKFKMFILN